jgi:hypothetical protein
MRRDRQRQKYEENQNAHRWVMLVLTFAIGVVLLAIGYVELGGLQ